ncbi:MAG: IS1380 family transposase, partial [bacterium]|nr:IS1380 family transposase [bacterium]
MKCNNRPGSFKITADGEGLVSHAGSALIGEVADKVGLTQALGKAMADTTSRQPQCDRGKALTDIAVAIADGADCLTDVDALRNQPDLFGEVASNSTLDRILSSVTDDVLKQMRK